MLNDADIAKHWPSVHTKIHLHKQQAFDHVNTMNSGHYADSATYFAYPTPALATGSGTGRPRRGLRGPRAYQEDDDD